MDRFLVSAIYKLSSALNDFDSICNIPNKEHYKGSLYRSMDKFFDFFMERTKYETLELFEKSELAWRLLVYDIPETIEEIVDADSRELMLWGLLLAKMESAFEDLLKVEKTMINNIITKPMVFRLSSLLFKPYGRRLPINTDGLKKLSEKITNTYLQAGC